ncbi:hypothetical protein, partial [uncultured Corynebacterium sp.]|uniref:hypothetical protein n=1 Tax=uncultured Corynebacterium sp. TaxID=159447 RepID=UPI0025DCBF61
QEEAMTQDTALSDEEQEKISQELSEGFETLFTEVVYEQSPGKWAVDYEAAERENVSAEEAESLVEFMEAPLPDETQPSVSAQSLGTYAECVVWNFAPVPMSPQDAAAIGNLLKAKQWRAAAEKITQVAASTVQRQPSITVLAPSEALSYGGLQSSHFMRDPVPLVSSCN